MAGHWEYNPQFVHTCQEIPYQVERMFLSFGKRDDLHLAYQIAFQILHQDCVVLINLCNEIHRQMQLPQHNV